MSDLVKREDVFETLYEAIRTDFKGTFINSVSLAIEMGNNIPPAQKKGEWIIEDDEMTETTWYECNICHIAWSNLHHNNFCPNCGAEMKGKDE